MAKKKTTQTLPRDVNQAAFLLVQRSTAVDDPSANDISRVMSALGKRGGKLGGKRRSEVLAPERRREIALAAARKRWDKQKLKPSD
jgi:hypothetical protein